MFYFMLLDTLIYIHLSIFFYSHKQLLIYLKLRLLFQFIEFASKHIFK